jgi:chitinase
MRDLLDPNDIVIDTGNSSRRATDEELLREYGLIQCEGDCQREMKDLGFVSLPVQANELSVPQTVAEACPTPGTTTVTVTASPIGVSVPTATLVARTASRVLSAVTSMVTESIEYGFWDGEVHDDEEDC